MRATGPILLPIAFCMRKYRWH